MAIVNPSFETAGVGAGSADGWIWVTLTAWKFARYGDSRFETFGLGWANEPNVDMLTGAAALYNTTNPQPFDGFESEWLNDGFLFVLDSAVSAEYSVSQRPPVGSTIEDFEVGWPTNESFVFAFRIDELEAIPDAPVDFESGWLNDVYLTAFAPGDVTAAIYTEGASTDPVETFEGFRADLPLSVTTPDTINSLAHGFVNGDLIRLFAAVDGESILPAGLNDRTNYFVVNAAANTFKVSTAPGGAPQTFTDLGSGATYIRADMTKFWGGKDGDTSGSDP